MTETGRYCSATLFSRLLHLLMVVVFLSFPLVSRATVIHVRAVGSDAADGLSWTSAKRTIQAALNAASEGDQVWVGAATYAGCITLVDGVALYGGFPSAGGAWEVRNPKTNVTTINANYGGSAVTAPYGAGPDTRVDGFTICYGRAYAGGGVYCFSSSPTIANNKILWNTAYGYCGYGGGISCENASPLITGNTIQSNTGVVGGGIYCAFDSHPTIALNMIVANTAPAGAGVFCADDSSPVISGNVLSGSTEAIRCEWNASVVIVNNTVMNHTSQSGSLCFSQSGGLVANNLIVSNSGGIGRDPSDPAAPELVTNCVFGNSAADYAGIEPGSTDMSVDPMRSSYRLTAGSPCINAGTLSVPGLQAFDLDGEARVWGASVDIGADEFRPGVLTLPQAKGRLDGTWVEIGDAVVTAAFGPCFYIQSDRLTALRVNLPNHGVTDGQRVIVTGKVATSASGERCIDDATVTVVAQ